MDVINCPTCLESLIFPQNMFDRKNKHLLNFLIRILDCKIEATDGTFNICLNCASSLKSCWIFKLNCEKSIEKLRDIEKDERFLENEIIILMKDVHSGKDIDSLNIQGTSELNNITKNDSFVEERRPSVRSSFTKPINRKKRKQLSVKNTQRWDEGNYHRRLVQFPMKVCFKAYKDCMRLFYSTRQCPICHICMRNRHRLGAHITQMHGEFRSKWCLRCNTIEDDLKEHNNTRHTGKGLFFCTLCDRNLGSAPEMRIHLERHSSSASKVKRRFKVEWLICEHCPEIFPNREQLDAHQCSNAPLQQVIDIETLQMKQQDMANIFEEITIKVVEEHVSVPKKIRNHYNKFPYDVVDRLLRETMTDFYTNRQCPICGVLTGNLSMLKLHMASDIHKDVNHKWCCKCNILADNLSKHIEEHPVEMYFCPFCHKDWNNRYKFKLHLIHHSDVPFATIKTVWFICTKCPKAFPYEDELRQHQQNECEAEIRNKSNKVNFTENADSRNKNAVVQQKKAKPNRPVKSCPICKAQVKHLSMHMKMVHIKVREQKPLNNVQITKENNTTEKVKQELHEIEIKDDKSGESEHDIKENSLVDFQERRDVQIKDIYLEDRKPREKKMGRPRKVNPDHFLCNHCGFKVSTITRLNNHLKTHTGDKPFECSICGKRFNVITSMRAHEARHLDVRQFPCDICGKLYMSKTEARMHRVMHETKVQECYVCKKHFCRPQLLKMHMRRHTDADKFPCNKCDATFHINRLLTRHIIDAHTKERPYKCTYCPRDFKFIERCNAHEKIHKGIKPYSCSCCSFVTTTPYSLTIHMRRHPEDLPQLDNPHKCELCYRCFSTNAMLLSHTKNVHLMAVTLAEHIIVQPKEEPLIGDWHQ